MWLDDEGIRFLLNYIKDKLFIYQNIGKILSFDYVFRNNLVLWGNDIFEKVKYEKIYLSSLTPTYRSGNCLVLLQMVLNPHLKPRSSVLAERVHRVYYA